MQLSYMFLDHTTDAFVEVTAENINQAFSVAADAVINITLNQAAVGEKQARELSASGKTLDYLLFNWVEEIVTVLITDGFAIGRISLDIEKGEEYRLSAKAWGEPLDLQKHGFKIEIKAPTFHEMEIRHNGTVTMRFLVDL